MKGRLSLTPMLIVFYIFSGLALIGMWLSIRLKHRATTMARKAKTNSVSESLDNIANPGMDTPVVG
jgi:hypothetical protein